MKHSYPALIAVFLVSFSLCFTSAQTASAHDASLTYTSITVLPKSVQVTMTTPYNNILASFPEKDKTIDELNLNFFTDTFQKGFIIENNGEKCNPHLITVKNIRDIKGIAYHFQFNCKRAMDKIHITDNLFFTISPTHENITDIHVGEHQEQHIFSIQRPTVDIDYHQIRTAITNGNIFTNIITFLTLGVKHIFGGTDHILFLLGLLLVATRFKSVLKIITAFTIAHSITLILSALNIFVLPARFTESMIALSIAYVAFENLKGTTHPRRWMIAFCFGLIHGFGFSSVLREIGLPHDGLILSLLSFNVGVEIGQLAIVSMIFPLLLFIQKHNWHTRFIKTVSIGIGIIGLFWFVQRAFFS